MYSDWMKKINTDITIDNIRKYEKFKKKRIMREKYDNKKKEEKDKC